MRALSILLLILIFIFSLMLVILNRNSTAVDLLFTRVPEMPLGLLIVLTLFLGVLIGLLMGIQVFKVFQTRWEITRLNKELDVLRKKHLKAVETISKTGEQTMISSVATAESNISTN